MKTNYNYRFFLKFGRKEHIEAFQKKGQIYMNSLSYFRQLPEENLIGDKYEGIRYLKPLRDTIFTTQNLKKNLSFKSRGIFYAHPTDKIEGNIFCLYGGHEALLEKNFIDKKNYGELNVGDAFSETEYLALINNPREFIKRLEIYFTSAGLEFDYRPVQYIDFDNYEGNLNQFSKRKRYENQNEFRIFVRGDIDRSLYFDIGDLSDICHIALTADHHNIKYTVTDPK
jgi:hypothetical protein